MEHFGQIGIAAELEVTLEKGAQLSRAGDFPGGSAKLQGPRPPALRTPGRCSAFACSAPVPDCGSLLRLEAGPGYCVSPRALPCPQPIAFLLQGSGWKYHLCPGCRELSKKTLQCKREGERKRGEGWGALRDGWFQVMDYFPGEKGNA